MSKIIVLALYFTILGTTYGAKAPVLIWSPNRPLSDLPQSYAGETVDDVTFHEKYLQPLTADPSQSVIVFMQDKLSIEDFTNHADVYNPNSDGGAFKNVKSAMDDQFSVNLPAVASPKAAIDTMSAAFPGEFIRVENPDKFVDLQLKDGKSYFIVVDLQPIQSQSEFGSFKKNDETIGMCLHHMNKRGVKYSAIYTAESSSKVQVDEGRSGRRLLATADDKGNGTFYVNEGLGLMMFLKYITVSITNTSVDNPKKGGAFTDTFPFDDVAQVNAEPVSEENSTAIRLTLTFTNDNGTATIAMLLNETNQYEFISWGAEFSYDCAHTKPCMFAVDKMPINYQIQATRGFCYHCTLLRPRRDFTRKYNTSDPLAVGLTMNGFQIEAFNPYTNLTANGTVIAFSLDVWDCVEFFTIPIWMGIFVTLILVTILFYGMSMLASITTMDRFDDPKGKTITVTVNE